MMDICGGPYTNQHKEVCYDANVCPVCAEAEAREDEVEDLKSKISSLESELEGRIETERGD